MEGGDKTVVSHPGRFPKYDHGFTRNIPCWTHYIGESSRSRFPYDYVFHHMNMRLPEIYLVEPIAFALSSISAQAMNWSWSSDTTRCVWKCRRLSFCWKIQTSMLVKVRVAVRDDLAEVEKLYAEFNQVTPLATQIYQHCVIVLSPPTSPSWIQAEAVAVALGLGSWPNPNVSACLLM